MSEENDIRLNNIKKIHDYLQKYFKETPYEFIAGATSFKEVYTTLLPVQQQKLNRIVEEDFDSLLIEGSILSIGIAYPDSILKCIGINQNGEQDIELWNNYSREYVVLNSILNDVAEKIGREFGGVTIPVTLPGLTSKVCHVTNYFGLTVSHRHIAELAGLGWRGKHGLLIHEKYSSAVRFVSVIIKLPVTHGSKVESLCENCTACEDVCTFIKHRLILPDYRENCRKYIVHLKKKGMENDVCGKCIKACFFQSIHRSKFESKGNLSWVK